MIEDTQRSIRIQILEKRFTQLADGSCGVAVLAVKLGVHPDVVEEMIHDAITRRGVRREELVDNSTPINQKIRELYLGGESKNSIAKALGCGVGRVYNVLKRSRLAA